MPITQGTYAAPTIGTTEYGLASASTTITPQTTDAVVTVHVDWSANLVAGDLYRIRALEKVNPAGSQVAFRDKTYYVEGPAAAETYQFGLLAAGWEIGITKIAGGDRATPHRLDTVTA